MRSLPVLRSRAVIVGHVGVILAQRPDDGEVISYCETLNLIVDYMRRPDAKSPTYPNSDDPLIWRYPPGAQP